MKGMKEKYWRVDEGIGSKLINNLYENVPYGTQ